MYKTLLEYACKNEQFNLSYQAGLENGSVEVWDERFLEKLKRLNVFSGFSFSFLDIFELGANIGTCLATAECLSFLFDDFVIHKGTFPALKGSEGAEYGGHAWLEAGGYIYDTSLMLKIDKEAAALLGYESTETKTFAQYMKDRKYIYQREHSVLDNTWFFEQKERVRKFEAEFLSD